MDTQQTDTGTVYLSTTCYKVMAKAKPVPQLAYLVSRVTKVLARVKKKDLLKMDASTAILYKWVDWKPLLRI